MTVDELVEASFEAWNGDDVEAWLPSLSPEIVYRSSGIFPGLEPAYVGHDGIRDFWRAMHEPWKSLRLELEQVTVFDDSRAVADFRFRAIGAESGAAVDLTFSNAARFEEGLIAELLAAPTHADAVRRLGLEP
jgi:ketosteroid isomerase-like protein